MSKWTNYGDVNPLEHGGTFVRAISDEEFQIIRVTPNEESEDSIRMQDLNVNVTDSWQDSEKVMAFADLKHDGENVLYAIALIDYYGGENFGTETYYTIEETKRWLRILEIEIQH